MPLHLLGKKSWNVYNSANIDRVQRDEEAARAKATRDERNKHERDAADRLKRLRGESPVVHEARASPPRISRKRKHVDDHEGEDEVFRRAVAKIDGGDSRRKERETSAENVDLDAISNMRFRDAAGRNNTGTRSWYLTSNSLEPSTAKTVGLDAFGREDAGRHSRDHQRTMAADPLAAMKRGVKQLREVEKQRAAWREERERDLNEVEELARRKERKQRRRESKRCSEGGRGHKHRNRSESDIPSAKTHRRSNHDRHGEEGRNNVT